MLLSEIKTDLQRDFFCLDWNDSEPFEIYGSELEDNYQRIEIILTPCNSVKTELGDHEGFNIISPNC